MRPTALFPEVADRITFDDRRSGRYNSLSVKRLTILLFSGISMLLICSAWAESIGAQVTSRGRLPRGVTSYAVKLTNNTDKVYDGVVLTVTGEPMSYLGLTASALGVFPDGTGSFYLFDREGGVLLPRQDKIVTIFHKGEGTLRVEAVGGDVQVAKKMADEARIESIFGAYTAQAKESFREMVRNPEAMRGLLVNSDQERVGEGVEAAHLQSISSAIIEQIGVAIGDSLSVRGGAPGAADVIAHREAVTSFSQAQKAYEMGDLEQAESLLRRSLSFFPGDGLVLNNLGYVIFLGKGDTAAAKDYINQALQLEPDNPYYLASLAEVLWSEGERKEAMRLIRQAHGLDPEGGSGANELMKKWEEEK